MLASSFIRCRSSGKGEGRARRDETRAVSMPLAACDGTKIETLNFVIWYLPQYL